MKIRRKTPFPTFEPSYNEQPHPEEPISFQPSSMTATKEIDYNRFQSRFYKQPPNQYESHFEQNQPQEFNYLYDDSFESYNNPVWSEASGSDIIEMDDPIHMVNNETSATPVSFSELLNPVYLTKVHANSSSRVKFAANLM